MLIAALIAVVITLSVNKKPAEPLAVAVAVKSKSFNLRIESTPAGAEVVERDRVLGKTPIELTIERESVAGGPRELLLRLEGYKSRFISQGSSESDVRVQAELLPEASNAPAVAPSATPRAPSIRPSAPPAPKPSAHPAPQPGNDIKLHR
jgi:hypothetical protein